MELKPRSGQAVCFQSQCEVCHVQCGVWSRCARHAVVPCRVLVLLMYISMEIHGARSQDSWGARVGQGCDHVSPCAPLRPLRGPQ